MKLLQKDAWMVQAGDAMCYHFVHQTFHNMKPREIETTPDRDARTQKRFKEKWGFHSSKIYKYKNIKKQFSEIEL